MTIADLIKYVDFMKERVNLLEKKVREIDNVKLTQRVIANNTTSQVVEQAEYTISPKELMAEYDKAAKELRLARQALEKINHTTEVDFEAKY